MSTMRAVAGGRNAHHRWMPWAALVVFLCALGGVLLLRYALKFTGVEQGVWFDGLSALFTLVGLVAALGALVIALPGYLEWAREQRRKPALSIWFAAAPIGKGTPVRFTDDRISLSSSGGRFALRVVVQNDGDGTLRGGMLNIMIARPGNFVNVTDPPPTTHRVLPATFLNSEIEPDKGPVDVCVSAVERDFTPNHFAYHLDVQVPGKGEYPIYATINGEPAQEVRQRGVVEIV